MPNDLTRPANRHATPELPRQQRPSEVASRGLDAPVVSAAVQDVLGNEAGLVGAGALSDVAAGATALAAAGFVGTGMPGTASLAAMRAILRASQAEAEGLDTRAAASNIGRRSGAPLPEPVRARLEGAFGHDFSHVRIHADGAAADAAEALNALAFTLGRDIYFSRGAFRPSTPDGLELLAHELTHVVQADEGRLPGPSGPGLDVSSPTDSHEREAYATGEAVARAVGTAGLGAAFASPSPGSGGGGGLAPLRNASPDAAFLEGAALASGPEAASSGPVASASAPGASEGTAASHAPSVGAATVSRAAASPGKDKAGASTASAAPKGRITLLGHGIDIQMPQGGATTATTSTPPDVPIQGVSVQKVDVRVGKNGEISGGTVTVDLTLGNTFVKGVRLEIQAGGVVRTASQPVDMDVPGLGRMRVSATVGKDGATTRGTVPPALVPLGGVLTASESSLQVDVTTTGRVVGSGLVKGAHPTLGAWTLQANWNGGAAGPQGLWDRVAAQSRGQGPAGGLTGTITVTAAPRTLAVGAQLQGGTLSGTWAGAGTLLSGRGDVVVRDTLRGRVDVEGAIGEGAWSASGQVTQFGTLGGRGFVLTGSVFRLDAQQQVATLRGGGTITHADVAGTFSGTLDPLTMMLSGTAAVSAPKPVDLAGRGVLRSLTGTATVEAGEITTVRGAAVANLTLGGIPTWYVRSEDMTYAPATRSITGEGGCALVREMVITSSKGHAVRIPGGPSCIGWVENSQVVELNGGLPCTLTDALGELARGRSGLVWDDAGRATGGVALTTSVRYGILDRKSDTLYLEAGAVGRLDIVSDELSDIVVETSRLVMRNGSGAGRIESGFAGTIFPATDTVDGRGKGSLVEEWPVPVKWGSFTFDKGGSVDVTVTPAGVSDLYGQLAFRAVVDGPKPLHVAGEYMGRFTREGGLDGGISGVLDESLRVAAGPDEIVLEEGATVAAPIAGGALESLRLEASATYLRAGAPFLQGRVTDARYGIKEQSVGFTGALQLLQDVTTPVPGGTLTATLERGSTPTITAENNAVVKIGGSFQVRVDDAKGKLYAGTLSEASIDPATWRATGTAAVATARELPWPRPADGVIPGAPGWTMVVREGSGLAGTMTDGAVTQALADFKVGVADPSGPLADGQLTGFVNLADDSADLSGSVTLGREIPLRATEPEAGSVRPKGWTAALVAGSRVGAHVTTEGLQRTDIDATAAFDQAGTRIATGTLAGAYKLGDTEQGFAGTATATLQKRLPWHEGTRFSTDVDVGTSLSLSVEKDAIGGGSGTVIVTGMLDGQDTLQAAGTMSYGEAEGLSGAPTATLLRELPMAGTGMKDGDQAVLLPSSQATAHIDKDELVGVDGVLRAGLRDGAGDYLEAVGFGAWNWADGKDHVDVYGRVSVLREQELGTSGPWKASLVSHGTEASADITDGTLARIDGIIGARVDRDGQGFAQVAAQGGWSPGEGVSGEGAASILVPEVHIADVGRFGLYLVEGTQAEAKVSHNEVERVGGDVPLEIRDGGRPFLRGDLDGDYWLKQGTYTGGGNASVLKDHVLSEANRFKVVILKGSGAGVHVKDNRVDRIGGDMQVAVHDEQGAFVAAGVRDGTWDFEGGTGFSGVGAAVITRRKELAEVNGFSFSLDLGTGAGVEVANDDIKRVDGAVPFIIGDAQGDLLKGNVIGEWNGATGMLGGNGTVTLARDLPFAEGRIVLKSGSGGTGVVVDSKLVSFTGGVAIDILGEGGDVVATLAGEGSYDAQSGTLVDATGAVRVLKDIPVLGADGGNRNALTVTELGGSGHVVMNELVSVDGDVHLAFGADGGVRGTGVLAGGWTREGDRDLFHGKGTVSIGIHEEKPRGITGAGLAAELDTKGDWSVSGSVDYQLNTYVGGSLKVEMDETWDPALTGELKAQGALVDARELFSFGKKIDAPSVKMGVGSFGYGVGIELSLDTLPLTLTSALTVGPWRPLSEASTVPDIDTTLDAEWGLDFHAALLPWMKLELGLAKVATVGAGIKGGVSVDEQAKAGAVIGLHAEGDDFWGSLGVGLEVSPTMTLSVSPFIDASLGPLHGEYAAGPYPLAQVDIFEVRWSDSFLFGDSAGKSPDPVGAIQKNPVKGTVSKDAASQVATQNHARTAKAPQTGDRPAVDGSGLGADKVSNAKNPLDGLVKTFEKVQKIAGAIGGMAKLVSAVITVITNLAAGPVGWLKMVWDIICGNLKFNDIADAVRNVIDGVPVLLKEIATLVPDWWKRIQEFVAKGTPSVINIFFGADQEAGKVIRDGETILHAPVPMMKQLIKTAIDGDWWTSEGDERNAMLVLEVCAQRGILREVVGNNADWFLANLDGMQDNRTRYLFWKAGIAFDGMERKQDYMHMNAYLGGN